MKNTDLTVTNSDETGIAVTFGKSGNSYTIDEYGNLKDILQRDKIQNNKNCHLIFCRQYGDNGIVIESCIKNNYITDTIKEKPTYEFT